MREAIRKLELEGFVVMIPRRGTYVADISIKDINEVYEIRTSLEVLAAGLAAERISDEELETMQRMLVEIGQHIEDWIIEKIVEIDTAFHDVLYKASRNKRLAGIINNLREQIRAKIPEIQETARALANIDVLASLAEAAFKYNYIKPELNNRSEIRILDGRHPVVERLLERDIFVPNDTNLNSTDERMIIITGPNMAGKSTYMRQVALLTLMTQMGSFIPARQASICPVDKIFTRVGASDDLATGQSTFMVEMNEVAQILKYATRNSLIILDEVGRGTSTFDGMSIARAVMEYIHEKIKAKTLFATHYHQLIELENIMEGVKNYSVAVKERGNDIVFLRRIVRGGSDKSYGVHVARLAGLPKKVLERANEFLKEYDSEGTKQAQPAQQQDGGMMGSLFGSALQQRLANMDVMSMTPIEAMNTLYKLQEEAKREGGTL